MARSITRSLMYRVDISDQWVRAAYRRMTRTQGTVNAAGGTPGDGGWGSPHCSGGRGPKDSGARRHGRSPRRWPPLATLAAVSFGPEALRGATTAGPGAID